MNGPPDPFAPLTTAHRSTAELQAMVDDPRLPRLPVIGRTAFVLFVVAVTVGVVGFLVGTSPNAVLRRAPTVATPVASAERARSYSDLRGERRGPNAGMYGAAAFAALGTPLETPGSAQAQAVRLLRRAYAGAPPVIPHPITQNTVGACLQCHEHGMTVGNKQAPGMSHERFASCTQCHAGGVDPLPPPRTRP